jgi:hypothetical protein
MKTLITLLFLATIGLTVAQAQKPVIVISDKAGWQKLGATTVNFEKDYDEVLVIGANRFASLKFMVKYAPVHFISMEVFFVGNTKETIQLNDVVKDEGEGKTIHLKGGERNIKKVVFIYKTLPNRTEKMHMLFYGVLKPTKDK